MNDTLVIDKVPHVSCGIAVENRGGRQAYRRKPQRRQQRDALEMLSAGLCIMPVSPDCDSESGKWQKRPLLRKGWRKLYLEPSVNRPTPSRIKRQFSNPQAVAVAIVCGDVSNDWCCRDFDDESAFVAWRAQHPDLVDGRLLIVKTRQGFHVWFRWRNPTGVTVRLIRERKGAPKQGEMRASKCYVIAPGSPFNGKADYSDGEYAILAGGWQQSAEYLDDPVAAGLFDYFDSDGVAHCVANPLGKPSPSSKVSEHYISPPIPAQSPPMTRTDRATAFVISQGEPLAYVCLTNEQVEALGPFVVTGPGQHDDRTRDLARLVKWDWGLGLSELHAVYRHWWPRSKTNCSERDDMEAWSKMIRAFNVVTEPLHGPGRYVNSIEAIDRDGVPPLVTAEFPEGTPAYRIRAAAIFRHIGMARDRKPFVMSSAMAAGIFFPEQTVNKSLEVKASRELRLLCDNPFPSPWLRLVERGRWDPAGKVKLANTFEYVGDV